jgi:pSer/pThr/pTyr-binding forkhead associated (FHA) protein
MLKLMVIHCPSPSETQLGSVVDVDGPASVLGRGSDVQIFLDHPDISRKHAAFSVSDGGWDVEDLQSTNGTRLNGRHIDRRQPIRRGDMLNVADYRFRVLSVTRPVQLQDAAA